MIAKCFEIRDAGTFIPILAVKLESTNEGDRYLLARSGYGRSADVQGENILLCQIAGGGLGKCTHDIYEWPHGRTYQVAHKYIGENFDTLLPGAVVDVEFILGETPKPKLSESITCYPGEI